MAPTQPYAHGSIAAIHTYSIAAMQTITTIVSAWQPYMDARITPAEPRCLNPPVSSSAHTAATTSRSSAERGSLRMFCA
eukprot:290132-Rhodomonas_salina.3